MTSLLEKVIAVIAPFRCISCSVYNNNVLCNMCLKGLPKSLASVCVVCQKVTDNGQTCVPCRKHTSLQQVWSAAEYQGAIAAVIKKLKFERAAKAAEVLADCMLPLLASLPENIHIVPVPTSSQRIRQRGYDQSVLIAQALARRLQRPVGTFLRRQTVTRQLGATRSQRQQQMQRAFEVVTNPGTPLLLIDDVMTTGATLRAAAGALERTGSTQLWAAVAAYHPPSHQR
jgi:ComF family protein